MRPRSLSEPKTQIRWRLLRIPSLEMGIYALGRLEFASQFEQEEPAVRAALIEAQVFLAYQKQLNNFSIQEGRLRKQCEKDRAELEQLQKERKALQVQRMKQAGELYEDARRARARFDPAEFGFEFSTREIEQHLADLDKRFAIRNRTFFSQKAVEPQPRA